MAEAPVLMKLLPEGTYLPSYLVVITQVANVGPMIYSYIYRRYKVSALVLVYFLTFLKNHTRKMNTNCGDYQILTESALGKGFNPRHTRCWYGGLHIFILVLESHQLCVRSSTFDSFVRLLVLVLTC